MTWEMACHPAVFARTRNALLASGAAGLVFFVAFPVAPPRLAGLGLVDTVTEQSHAYRLLQPPALTDQYAAMPSLHVGWNLLLGLAIATTARHTWVRAAGVAMPAAMTLAVVLTANHYILDAVVGAALTAAAWLLTGPRGRRAGAVALSAVTARLTPLAAGVRWSVGCGARVGLQPAHRPHPAVALSVVGLDPAVRVPAGAVARRRSTLSRIFGWTLVLSVTTSTGATLVTPTTRTKNARAASVSRHGDTYTSMT